MRETSTSIAVGRTDAIDRTRAFLGIAFPAPRSFAIRLWDGSLLPGPPDSPFTMVLMHPGALRRMFSPPIELSVGEAYLRRDFDIEGDLCAAFDFIHGLRANLGSPRVVLELALQRLFLPRDAPPAPVAAPRGAQLEGDVRSRSRAGQAIGYHYDVGNDFYRLFLDWRMIYSCAYFRQGTETIDDAQEAKLDLICRKLRLRQGDRLLDIGCGWGGLLIHAAERYGISGLGVTLSDEQYRLATERIAQAGLQDRLKVEKRDYRDLHSERFDKIVSVGMFEHVGRVGRDEYFQKVRELLEPGGLFLNHAISDRPKRRHRGLRGAVTRAIDNWIVGNYTFRNRYIFPDGELMPISEANYAAERAGLEVRDVENLREHYALTLRHWLDRLRERREQAVLIAGQPIFRLWEMYLAGCAFHFDTGRITVNQTLFSFSEDGNAGLELTREAIYG